MTTPNWLRLQSRTQTPQLEEYKSLAIETKGVSYRLVESETSRFCIPSYLIRRSMTCLFCIQHLWEETIFSSLSLSIQVHHIIFKSHHDDKSLRPGFVTSSSQSQTLAHKYDDPVPPAYIEIECSRCFKVGEGLDNSNGDRIPSHSPFKLYSENHLEESQWAGQGQWNKVENLYIRSPSTIHWESYFIHWLYWNPTLVSPPAFPNSIHRLLFLLLSNLPL